MKLPVLVFLHGGGFSFGSSDSKLFAPDYLMDQNIMLVTLNYRLNIFGEQKFIKYILFLLNIHLLLYLNDH